MMNKLGKLLNYPETWCSFIIRFALLVILTAMVILIAALPLIVYIDRGFTSEFYFILFVVTVFCCVGHSLAKDIFDGYRAFWDKLPKCPKINWDKGE